MKGGGRTVLLKKVNSGKLILLPCSVINRSSEIELFINTIMIEIIVKTGTFAVIRIDFGNKTWEIGFIYEKICCSKMVYTFKYEEF